VREVKLRANVFQTFPSQFLHRSKHHTFNAAQEAARMSALKNVAQGFRNLWGAADEEDDYTHDEEDSSQRSSANKPEPETAYHDREERPERSSERSSERAASRGDNRYEKFTAPVSSHLNSEPSYGGGGAGAHRLRPINMPLRASREKNIYTLKPKSLDESSMAADYLKTGCAVVLNLEEVESATAIRIIDFMSGVCYGLEHQGHAMKLGDKIFLFTPGDFEISSDEVDYAENRDLIFKDVVTEPALKAPAPPVSNPERRSWER
jgi:cell division inhibitor SepF